jgi:hypothetical protein
MRIAIMRASCAVGRRVLAVLAGLLDAWSNNRQLNAISGRCMHTHARTCRAVGGTFA